MNDQAWSPNDTLPGPLVTANPPALRPRAAVVGKLTKWYHCPAWIQPHLTRSTA